VIHSTQLLKRSVESIAVRVFGAVAGFAFQVALARALGVSGTGVYHLAATIATAGSVVGRLGLDNTLLRRAATAHAAGDPAAVAGVFRRGMAIGASGAGAVALALALAAPAVSAWLLPGTRFAVALALMALAVAPLALSSLCGEFFKALGHAAVASFVQGASIPLLNLTALVLLGGLIREPEQAAALYLASSSVVLAACLIAWWQFARNAPPPAAVDGPGLVREARPMYAAALATAVAGSADTVVLGALGDALEVGRYGASWRIAVLFGLISLGINAVVAPRFAALHDASNPVALRALCTRSCLLAVGLGLPPLAVCLTAPARLLSLFGAEFEPGAPLLQLLALGRFAWLATAPVGHLFQMAGRARLERDVSVLSAVALVVLTVLLTSRYGATGTAAGACAAMAGGGVARGLLAWRWLRRPATD
jgi:O-antigen/teichoic acid export membrane protein